MLFRVPEGSDASIEYERMIAQQEIDCADLEAWKKRPVSAAARAEMERIAEALQSWRPKLERFQPASPLPWIELTDESLPIQFEISEGSVSVTVAYFGDNAAEVMEYITRSFELLQAAAGYSAYDPQLGRAVTSADLNEMVQQYDGVNDAFPEVMAHGRSADTPAKKPWWKIW